LFDYIGAIFLVFRGSAFSIQERLPFIAPAPLNSGHGTLAKVGSTLKRISEMVG